MFPIQSVWLLRISLVYFLIGSLIGGFLLSEKVFLWNENVWILLPIHYSILIWGFFIQFIIGTAYWMFPKHLSHKPRGSELQAWFLIFFYNFGFLLVLLSLLDLSMSNLGSVGKLFMFFAILIFIKLIWVRSISYNP